MSAAGAIDSGVDTTSNESNDLDDTEGIMTEIRVMTEDLSSGSQQGPSLSDSSSGILGAGDGVGCNRISLKDTDGPPPPPPPTSPNICAGATSSQHASDEDVHSLIHNRDELVPEDSAQSQSSFNAEHGSNNEDSEAMDRDMNYEDFDSFSQSPTNVAIDSDSDEIQDDHTSVEDSSTSSFAVNFSNVMDSSGCGSSVESDKSEFCFHSSQSFLQPMLSQFSPPPAPPVTPTQINSCKALVKFQFPELPKLTHFGEPPGLRTFLSVEQLHGNYHRTNFDPVNICTSSASNSSDCTAMIPYQQSDLHRKARTFGRFARHKLYDKWVHVRKDYRERRLRLAVRTGSVQLVLTLLQDGVDPNAADELGRTSLHLACVGRQREIVRHLLNAGADPNKKDSIGNTPLHLAACSNDFEIVTCLLRAGTDVSTVDNNGRNPLQLAQSKLKLFTNRKYNSADSLKVKLEVQQITEMMLEYFQKSGKDTEAELLNAFANKLTLSQTPEEVDEGVKNLLDNLDSLSLDTTPKPQVHKVIPPRNPYLIPNLNPSLARRRNSTGTAVGSIRMPSAVASTSSYSNNIIKPSLFKTQTPQQEQQKLIKSLQDSMKPPGNNP